MTTVLVLTRQQMINAQPKGRGPYHYLYPSETADGRFAISANALVDPAYAGVRAILEQGSLEDHAGLSLANIVRSPPRYVFSGIPWRVYAGKEWSFTAPQANVLRFELRPGDQGISSDPVGVRHRVEINTEGSIPLGVTYWMSYAYRIAGRYGGFGVDGNYSIVGQWHDTDSVLLGRRPPIACNVSRRRLQVQTASSETGGSQVLVRYNSNVDIPLDVWQFRVQKVTFGDADTGELRQWENGVELSGLGNIPNCYFDNPETGYRAQLGIYAGDVNHPDVLAARSSGAMATAISVVEIANLELGTADLSDRILNPLAI